MILNLNQNQSNLHMNYIMSHSVMMHALMQESHTNHVRSKVPTSSLVSY